MDPALGGAPAAGPEGSLLAGLGALLFATPRPTPVVLAALSAVAFFLVLLRRVILRSRPGVERAYRLAGRVEMGVLALLLLAMVVLAATQILLRNAFGVGLLWVDPMLRYLTLWIGFVGAAVAAADGRHIQIDVLTHTLAPGVRRVTGRITNLAAAGICAVLFESAYRHLATEYAFDTRVFLNLPSWLLLAVIPVGLGLLTYRFLDRTIALPQAAPPAAADSNPGASAGGGGERR